MSYTKIIFLDFDGVLNHVFFYRNNVGELTADHPDGMNRFDEGSIEQLNRIVKETGAKVVVSSSWRFSRDKDELQVLLRFNGFEGEVVDTTPIYLDSYTHRISRGEEVKAWLEKNHTEKYCILDDCNDFLDEQTPYFVWCDDFGHGLWIEEADKAIEILNGEN